MKQLLENKEYLRKIADTLFEFLIVFSGSGDIEFANEGAYNVLMYNSMDDVNIADILPNVFSLENGKLICRESMDGRMIAANAYRSNKTCFESEVRILLDENTPDRIICIGRDISGRERMMRELKFAKDNGQTLNKVKDEFVANVTHELRTPVNGILGNIQDLMGTESDPNRLYTMEMIEKSCADMNALINNILDFSKLEAGKFEIEEREFSLHNMIDYVRSNHMAKIHEKGLDFFVTISPDIPDRLIGDELRLEQVLNNLLSNATKFTTVGKIMLEVVSTAKAGDKIELFFMVVDTGIGIADKDKDKLFKDFSQVDASISRKYGGTGLGLNISKKLVNLMEGDISVDSMPGKGSNFNFSVWLKVPSEEGNTFVEDFRVDAGAIADRQMESLNLDESATFGSQENREEIDKRMMKLTLCVEMDTWEKAEMFAEAVKQLTAGAPKEVTTAALRLKMAVQKENKEKTLEAMEALRLLLD